MAKKRSKFTREPKSAAKRRTFSREFKAEAVKLAKDTGKGVAAVAKDLGLSESSLYLWAKQPSYVRRRSVEKRRNLAATSRTITTLITTRVSGEVQRRKERHNVRLHCRDFTRTHHIVGEESFPHEDRIRLAQVAPAAEVDGRPRV